MKKVLLLSILCLCLGTVACSKGSDTVTAVKPEGGNNDVTTEANDDATTDTNDGENNEPSQEEPTTSVEDIVAKDEIVNASWDSGLVQINDTIIQLPANLSTFVDAGLDYEIWIRKSKKEKTYLIAPDEEVLLRVIVGGQMITNFQVKNETNDFLEMADINPSIASLIVTDKPVNAVMFFAGGLTFGDSYKLIVEKLGTAKEITKNMTYVYGSIDSGLGMEVGVDKNNQSINTFYVDYIAIK